MLPAMIYSLEFCMELGHPALRSWGEMHVIHWDIKPSNLLLSSGAQGARKEQRTADWRGKPRTNHTKTIPKPWFYWPSIIFHRCQLSSELDQICLCYCFSFGHGTVILLFWVSCGWFLSHAESCFFWLIRTMPFHGNFIISRVVVSWFHHGFIWIPWPEDIWTMPFNLVAGSTGIVKITDFGVSGELEDDIEQKNKVTFAAGNGTAETGEFCTKENWVWVNTYRYILVGWTSIDPSYFGVH